MDVSSVLSQGAEEAKHQMLNRGTGGGMKPGMVVHSYNPRAQEIKASLGAP